MASATPSDIVNKVRELWDNGYQDDEKIQRELESTFDLTDDDAAWALEMVKTGTFRALIISSGKKYPNNNLDDEPVLSEALRTKLVELGKADLITSAGKKNSSWWKFW